MLYGIPLQTAYVTTNLDSACQLMAARYGITRFLRPGPKTFQTDDGTEMTLSMAHAWVGSSWLELIEPVAGGVSLYSNWLPKDGFSMRFHHFGIRLHGVEAWNALVSETEGAGFNRVFSVTKGEESHKRKAIYIDTVKDLGHYLEYLYYADVSGSYLELMPQNIPGFKTVY